MNCPNCNSPVREIYGPHKNRPVNKLISIDVGNWIQLFKCSVCNGLWVSGPYEP